MTTVAPPNPIFELMDYIRANAQARARQTGAWLDVYLHTLPPPARVPALKELLGIWCAHQHVWTSRVDGGVALPAEYHLSSFDWSETEAALRTLLRDMESADA